MLRISVIWKEVAEKSPEINEKRILHVDPINLNFCSLNAAKAAPILGKPEGITVHYDGTFGVLAASV